MKNIDGGVTAPKGYRASGVRAGLKPGSDKEDCALLLSDEAATVSGMFTTSVMKAPPVHWDVKICAGGHARGVFINSVNANAATGEQGHKDVQATAERLAATLNVSDSEMCICSTGVIGVPMPMDLIFEGIDSCANSLSEGGSLAAATAIMTTDTIPKEFAVELPLTSGTVRLGAIAKGSGMISPNMATMICIVTTDADIAPELSQTLLRSAVRSSFNRISVDNDMSTSDTVLLFANGQSGISLEEGSADAAAFGEALTAFCQEAAKALVKDGEGATKFVEIAVSGTATDEDAERIARAIGNSQLCKTAFFGEDPNWGRFACAAGYAGVDFDPAALDIRLGDVQLTQDGLVADYTEEDAAAIMLKDEFRIELSVGTGPGKAVFWTSDLSHGYVSINADYRS